MSVAAEVARHEIEKLKARIEALDRRVLSLESRRHQPSTPQPSSNSKAAIVIAVISRYFGVTANALRGRGREQHVVWPRQLCYHFLHTKAGYSHAAALRRMGRRWCCPSGFRRVQNLVHTDARCRAQFDAIARQIDGAMEITP